MRLLYLAMAGLMSMPLAAQDKDPQEKKKPAAKKSASKKQPPVAHGARKKPTPEQIRKFNELQKKQQS